MEKVGALGRLYGAIFREQTARVALPKNTRRIPCERRNQRRNYAVYLKNQVLQKLDHSLDEPYGLINSQHYI